jgi:nitroreductase
MEFQQVVNRRRMVRTYLQDRPVPPDVVHRIVQNALRAPSAGFSQGTGFLVLDSPEDVARFRDAATPEEGAENWFAANVEAPLVIVALSNKDTYLDRYAQPDKGFTDRSDRFAQFRQAFGVPPEFSPIGVVSIGYSDEPPRDLTGRRRPTSDLVRFRRWDA